MSYILNIGMDLYITCIFLIVFIGHWVADFVFQSQSMSQNKSSSWFVLAVHCFIYATVTWAFMAAALSHTTGHNLYIWNLLYISHFTIDAVTSRITKELYKKKDYHNFFVVIGLDQLLHAGILLWCIIRYI